MNPILRKIRTFLAMRSREKLWFFLLFVLSGIARAAILTVPFRHVAPYLGRHYQNEQLACIATKEQLQTAWRIGRITESVSKYTPWQSKCLVQAMMVRSLLGYYDIPYVMHLGVTKSQAGEGTTVGDENVLKAHAWLSVGPWIVSGREGHRAFTIVSTFVQPSLLEPLSTKRSCG